MSKNTFGDFFKEAFNHTTTSFPEELARFQEWVQAEDLLLTEGSEFIHVLLPFYLELDQEAFDMKMFEECEEFEKEFGFPVTPNTTILTIITTMSALKEAN